MGDRGMEERWEDGWGWEDGWEVGGWMGGGRWMRGGRMDGRWEDG